MAPVSIEISLLKLHYRSLKNQFMADDNSTDVVGGTNGGDSTTKAKEAIYCAICTFPPEVFIPKTYSNGSTVNSVDH